MYDKDFNNSREVSLSKRAEDSEFREISAKWLKKSVSHKYSYNFDWMGVPIIQYPEDLIAFQEVVWSTQPDLIIECGVARGGSLLFWASLMELSGRVPNVIGIDVLIQDHTRRAISESKYANSVQLIEGDSTSEKVIERITKLVDGSAKVMVILDSNHTEDHVLEELKLYANFVSEGCYLLVMDTLIEFLDIDPERPWGPGRNPWTATRKFMAGKQDFENDGQIESKLSLSAAPNGYWRRVMPSTE